MHDNTPYMYKTKPRKIKKRKKNNTTQGQRETDKVVERERI